MRNTHARRTEEGASHATKCLYPTSRALRIWGTTYKTSYDSPSCDFVYDISRTHTYIHTHPFNGPFSGSTRVNRYQKGKTDLDFTEATATANASLYQCLRKRMYVFSDFEKSTYGFRGHLITPVFNTHNYRKSAPVSHQHQTPRAEMCT